MICCMAAGDSRKAAKGIKCPILVFSAKKETKAARNFSKLILIKLQPTESITGRRNEHKVMPERSR